MQDTMVSKSTRQAQYLIFGGNSGIGQAVAQELEALGQRVLCFGRNSNPPFVAEEEGDLPRIDGPLQGLLYCPGTLNLAPFERLQPADLRADFEVNLVGAARVLQAYLPQLREAQPGAVVLFSTVAAEQGMPFHASIAAAKGAVEGFARSVAAELAPSVRVNVVAPSLTETPLAQRLLKSDRQREAAAQRHPMGRIGQPSDAAALTSFLLSPRAGWITGQVIGVDGGLSSLRKL